VSLFLALRDSLYIDQQKQRQKNFGAKTKEKKNEKQIFLRKKIFDGSSNVIVA
jgi:hypothetical protein